MNSSCNHECDVQYKSSIMVICKNCGKRFYLKRKIALLMYSIGLIGLFPWILYDRFTGWDSLINTLLTAVTYLSFVQLIDWLFYRKFRKMEWSQLQKYFK